MRQDDRETATARRSHRIYTIPAEAPFLDVVATSLVGGRLVPGFVPQDDPLLLQTATIYLPTRRSVRALSARFVKAMGGRACLLPEIRALGDDEADFHESTSERLDAELPCEIGELRRRLILSRLIRGWTAAMSAETRSLLGDEDVVIPSSAAEALALADELARLMDGFSTEEVGLEALDRLVGQDTLDGRSQRWAEWWNLTLHFLSILRRTWPAILAENNAIDAAERRRRVLDRRTESLLQSGSKGPVIVAGSTGSIPATARFIAAVAAYRNGAVILPGLDCTMPETVWSHLCRPDREDDTLSACTHPQYGLAQLLRKLGVSRDDVTSLSPLPPVSRSAIVANALLPSFATGLWSSMDRAACDVSGMALIEAPTERLEALAIAIALRETLEDPAKTAALVTPDRILAQRVVAELGRFGIAIDDSGGAPLVTTPPATLAMLLIKAASGVPDPAVLAALLKNPFVCGDDDGPGARIARLFELAVLRGAIRPPRLGELATAAGSARTAVSRKRAASMHARVLTPAEWDEVIAYGGRLDSAADPLVRCSNADGRVQAADMVGALQSALAAILAPQAKDEFAGQPGAEALATVFDAFGDAHETDFDMAPAEFDAVLETILGNETERTIRAAHPRLAILGPLEARLQQFDRVILGGLNEGTWPSAMRNDAFLNRQMRAEIGLSTPERRIGQSAHDFQQLCGHAEVIFGRALRSGGVPTVASRWLQRLASVAGETMAERMRHAGSRYLELAHAMDAPKVREKRAARPNPKPPTSRRPLRLSVTEIETWIRDPYAIHAKHVLGLRPLQPLERVSDPLLRGQIYHEVLANFVSGRGPDQDDATRFDTLARTAFDAWQVPPAVRATWLPRFLAIGRNFLAWEAGRRPGISASHCEVDGSISIGDSGFELHGRADRIDMLRDGTLAILDYKTGTNPSKKQAQTLSPQLALEGNIALRGGFRMSASLAGAPAISELAYVRLVPSSELIIDDPCTGRNAPTVDVLVSSAWEQLVAMIDAYGNPDRGYPSRSAPMQESEITGDYDHLARVREWANGDGEDGDD